MICEKIKDSTEFINEDFPVEYIKQVVIQDYDEIYLNISMISKNSKNMNYILQSFIDYSQVNTDEFVLNVKEFHVQNLISRVID